MLKNGLLVGFGKTGTAFLIDFTANVVIARLLLPHEIGIFSVVVAFLAILHALRDFGLNRFLVKEPDLSLEKLRTVFALAVVVSWSFGAVVLTGRGVLASFYAEPKIAGLLALLSLNFFLLPFYQPALGLLMREQRYARLALLEISSSAIGASVSISFAWSGAGPEALAYGALAGTATTVVLGLWLAPTRSYLIPTVRHWRSISAFGGLASTEAVVKQGGMQAPELIVGRVLDFAAAGLFSRAFGLATAFERFFGAAVTWFAGPELGSHHRSGRSFRPFVLKMMDLTMIVGWPALAVLAAKSEAIVLLLFGENWIRAAPILQILCLARAISLLFSQAGPIYLGAGAVKLQLRNELIIQSVSISLLAIAAQVSLELVAWSRVPLAVVAVLVHSYALSIHADLSLWGLLAELRKTILISVLFLALLCLILSLEPTSLKLSVWALLGELFLFGLIYVGLLVSIKHPLAKSALDLLASLIP